MVDDLEKRQEALRLLRAVHAAEDAAEEADEDEASKALVEAAHAAYEDFDSPALEQDYEGEPLLCAKSGIPIWVTDEIVEDFGSGESFLRCELGLPPRQVEEVTDADVHVAE